MGQRGKIEEAIVQFRQAIELNPDYDDAHFNLAVALQMKDEWEEAVHHYRETIRINPSYRNAQSKLDQALSQIEVE